MSDKDKREIHKQTIKKRIRKALINTLIYFAILIFIAIVVVVFSFLASLLVIFSRSVGNPNESFTSLFQSDFLKVYIKLLKVNGISDFIIFSLIPKYDLFNDDD